MKPFSHLHRPLCVRVRGGSFEGASGQGVFGTGSFGIDEITTVGNAAHLLRLDEWALPRTNDRLSTKGKCLLVLAFIDLLLGPAFLWCQAAFGFFLQHSGELL